MPRVRTLLTLLLSTCVLAGCDVPKWPPEGKDRPRQYEWPAEGKHRPPPQEPMSHKQGKEPPSHKQEKGNIWPPSIPTVEWKKVFDVSGLLAFVGSDRKVETVKVYFGTNREQNRDTFSWNPYGSRRGDRLRYGSCDVSIPVESRTPGEIPRPVFTSEKGDPKKHFVLSNPEEYDRSAFFELLQQRLSGVPTDAMLVFVHGYNVSFDGAAFRAAQVAFDLKFAGPPIFYSWPSVGEWEDYATDYENVRDAMPLISEFLEDLATRTETKRIYLIAHSMGNQALPQALLDLLARRPDTRSKFRELILAAPDIDADIYRKQIAPRLKDWGIGVTLYASDKDRALIAARKIRDNYVRAGEIRGTPLIVEGTETIDASSVETDFLVEHTYFADSESILSDIFYIVKQGLRAPQRFGLQEIPVDKGRYWKVVTGTSTLRIVLYTLLAVLAVYVAFRVVRRWRRSTSPGSGNVGQ